MRTISNSEKAKAVKWLQKQRDGLIIGDYRNILYNIYQTIQNISQTSSVGCSLEKLTETMADKFPISNQLLEFCETLCELGYIKISYNDDIILLTILQPIDF